jgi:hypothetical protein
MVDNSRPGISKGRETTIELENNPLPRRKHDEALKEIQKENPNADMSFRQD